VGGAEQRPLKALLRSLDLRACSYVYTRRLRLVAVTVAANTEAHRLNNATLLYIHINTSFKINQQKLFKNPSISACMMSVLQKACPNWMIDFGHRLPKHKGRALHSLHFSKAR